MVKLSHVFICQTINLFIFAHYNQWMHTTQFCIVCNFTFHFSLDVDRVFCQCKSTTPCMLPLLRVQQLKYVHAAHNSQPMMKGLHRPQWGRCFGLAMSITLYMLYHDRPMQNQVVWSEFFILFWYFSCPRANLPTNTDLQPFIHVIITHVALCVFIYLAMSYIAL